jgi:hypothetical protein
MELAEKRLMEKLPKLQKIIFGFQNTLKMKS